MSGTTYAGLIIEQPRIGACENAVGALRAFLVETVSRDESAPGEPAATPAGEVVWIEYGHAVWMGFDGDATRSLGLRSTISTWLAIAPLVARACQTHVWAYAYASTSWFGVDAVRFGPDGARERQLTAGDETPLPAERGGDPAAAPSDLLAAVVHEPLCAAIGWPLDTLAPPESDPLAVAPEALQQHGAACTLDLDGRMIDTHVVDPNGVVRAKLSLPASTFETIRRVAIQRDCSFSKVVQEAIAWDGPLAPEGTHDATEPVVTQSFLLPAPSFERLKREAGVRRTSLSNVVRDAVAAMSARSSRL